MCPISKINDNQSLWPARQAAAPRPDPPQDNYGFRKVLSTSAMQPSSSGHLSKLTSGAKHYEETQSTNEHTPGESLSRWAVPQPARVLNNDRSGSRRPWRADTSLNSFARQRSSRQLLNQSRERFGSSRIAATAAGLSDSHSGFADRTRGRSPGQVSQRSPPGEPAEPSEALRLRQLLERERLARQEAEEKLQREKAEKERLLVEEHALQEEAARKERQAQQRAQEIARLEEMKREREARERAQQLADQAAELKKQEAQKLRRSKLAREQEERRKQQEWDDAERERQKRDRDMQAELLRKDQEIERLKQENEKIMHHQNLSYTSGPSKPPVRPPRDSDEVSRGLETQRKLLAAKAAGLNGSLTHDTTGGWHPGMFTQTGAETEESFRHDDRRGDQGTTYPREPASNQKRMVSMGVDTRQFSESRFVQSPSQLVDHDSRVVELAPDERERLELIQRKVLRDTLNEFFKSNTLNSAQKTAHQLGTQTVNHSQSKHAQTEVFAKKLINRGVQKDLDQSKTALELKRDSLQSNQHHPGSPLRTEDWKLTAFQKPVFSGYYVHGQSSKYQEAAPKTNPMIVSKAVSSKVFAPAPREPTTLNYEPRKPLSPEQEYRRREQPGSKRPNQQPKKPESPSQSGSASVRKGQPTPARTLPTPSANGSNRFGEGSFPRPAAGRKDSHDAERTVPFEPSQFLEDKWANSKGGYEPQRSLSAKDADNSELDESQGYIRGDLSQKAMDPIEYHPAHNRGDNADSLSGIGENAAINPETLFESMKPVEPPGLRGLVSKNLADKRKGHQEKKAEQKRRSPSPSNHQNPPNQPQSGATSIVTLQSPDRKIPQGIDPRFKERISERAPTIPRTDGPGFGSSSHLFVKNEPKTTEAKPEIIKIDPNPLGPARIPSPPKLISKPRQPNIGVRPTPSLGSAPRSNPTEPPSSNDSTKMNPPQQIKEVPQLTIPQKQSPRQAAPEYQTPQQYRHTSPQGIVEEETEPPYSDERPTDRDRGTAEEEMRHDEPSDPEPEPADDRETPGLEFPESPVHGPLGPRAPQEDDSPDLMHKFGFTSEDEGLGYRTEKNAPSENTNPDRPKPTGPNRTEFGRLSSIQPTRQARDSPEGQTPSFNTFALDPRPTQSKASGFGSEKPTTPKSGVNPQPEEFHEQDSDDDIDLRNELTSKKPKDLVRGPSMSSKRKLGPQSVQFGNNNFDEPFELSAPRRNTTTKSPNSTVKGGGARSSIFDDEAAKNKRPKVELNNMMKRPQDRYSLGPEMIRSSSAMLPLADPKPSEPDNRDFYLDKPKPGGFTISKAPRFDNYPAIETLKHIKTFTQQDHISANQGGLG